MTLGGGEKESGRKKRFQKKRERPKVLCCSIGGPCGRSQIPKGGGDDILSLINKQKPKQTPKKKAEKKKKRDEGR